MERKKKKCFIAEKERAVASNEYFIDINRFINYDKTRNMTARDLNVVFEK